LQDLAPLARQNLMISRNEDPDLNALFHKYFVNCRGRHRWYREYEGIVDRYADSLRLCNFKSPVLREDDHQRMKSFTKSVIPFIKKQLATLKQGVLIVARNELFSHDILRALESNIGVECAVLAEHTDLKEITRGRARFAEGLAPICLLTERMHHFRRLSIKGVSSIIFYNVPFSATYAKEMLNFLDRSRTTEESKVLLLCSKWDRLQIEAMLGTKSMERMNTFR